MLTWTELPALFPHLADPGRWLPLLERHAQLLAAANVRTTAVAPEEAIARNYAESLEAYRLAGPATTGVVVDVGSGGGVPGIVIAVVAPALEVHLVEAHRRTAALLSVLAEELGLGRVTVHAERAEEAGRGILRDRADLVFARAVAPLPVLLEYTASMTRADGVVAAIKGSRAARELQDSAGALAAMQCEHIETQMMRPAISEHGCVQLFRKVGPTPERYPRRPGMAAKRPIATPPPRSQPG